MFPQLGGSMALIECRIFVDRPPGCCRSIKFRMYLGHYASKAVHVAIRHLTENECKKGLGCLGSALWFRLKIKDVVTSTVYEVLVNKKSFLKRLQESGIPKNFAQAMLKSRDFSVIRFEIDHLYPLRQASSAVFYSHGPLL
jgi:hypothetical protein